MSNASSLPANKKYNKKKVNIGSVIFGSLFVAVGFIAAYFTFSLLGKGVAGISVVDDTYFFAMFFGVGGAMIWSSLKNDDLKNDLEKIRQQGIPSLEKSLDKILTVVAAVVALPGAIIAMLGLINWEGYGFNSLLFFLFSGVLYLHARNMRRDYEKIGPTVVFADPIPAIIGHEVGGFFMLAAKPRNDLTMRLSCLHTYSSGSGDNSSKTMVVHQQETAAYLEPQGDGVQKVSFLFQLPEDKPESDSPEYRGTISWELSATGMVTNDTKVPGTQIAELIELKRTWKLPVLSQAYASALGLTAEASRVSIPQQHQQSVELQYRRAAENSVEQQIDMQTDAQGATEIVSEAGRNSSMWGILLGLGAIFGLVGLGLLLVMLEEGGVLWVMAPVFTLVGWGLFALGVFLAGRKLEARIYQGNVQVIRSVFGRQLYQRSGQITSPSQLSLKETMSSTSQDHVKTEYMAIYVDIDGKKIKLAEGIEGRLAGEVMMDKINAALTQELDAELSG